MSKYKYYFRKPKSEIVKDIMLWLGVGGAVALTDSSPIFARGALDSFQKWLKKEKKYTNKKVYDAFSEQTLIGSDSPLTTNLPDDPSAQGKGIVQ